MPLLMAKRFFQGSHFFIQGFVLIARPEYRKYVIGPVLLNILFFSGISYVAFKGFIKWFIAISPWSSLPSYLFILVKVLIGLFSAILLSIGIGLFCSILVNLISSGLNGFLCEAVYLKLTDKTVPTESFWRMTCRTLHREKQKLLYFLPRALVVWLFYAGCYFIPVLNILGLVVLSIFGAWMVGVQYMDYPADLLQIKFVDFRAKLAKERMLVLGFGSMALFTLSLPLLNCIAIPVAIAGATQLWITCLSE